MADNILVKDRKYEGQYVAMRSLGNDPSQVLKQARAKGAAAPVIVFVPEPNMTLIY
jgi:hypothetical protein